MKFKIGDIVALTESDQPDDPDELFAISVEDHNEFIALNGREWEIMRLSSGWWSDTQPWVIKSKKSGHEIERFEDSFRLVLSKGISMNVDKIASKLRNILDGKEKAEVFVPKKEEGPSLMDTVIGNLNRMRPEGMPEIKPAKIQLGPHGHFANQISTWPWPHVILKDGTLMHMHEELDVIALDDFTAGYKARNGRSINIKKGSRVAIRVMTQGQISLIKHGSASGNVNYHEVVTNVEQDVHFSLIPGEKVYSLNEQARMSNMEREIDQKNAHENLKGMLDDMSDLF